MTPYQVLLSDSPGYIDIGEFPDDQAARLYGVQTFGNRLIDVQPVYAMETGTSTLDPAWLVLGMVVFMLWAASQKPKKKRGRNVLA